MNKLLEKTLRLAGVLLEDKDTDEQVDLEVTDDKASDVEPIEDKPEEKKDDAEPKEEPEEKEESGTVESFISETYSTLREKSWAFVDEFFDDMAEEFNEDITNAFINGGEAGADIIEQITEKLEDIKKWIESKLSGESKSADEKDTDEKDELDDITDELVKK